LINVRLQNIAIARIITV